MKNICKTTRILTAAAVFAGCLILLPGTAWSHCDTINGPVVQEAKIALEKHDVTPILKWVKQEYEAEIKTAFASAIVVRDQGPEAKELADRYFIEALVRLHRAGENAPYTGIKNEPIEPIIVMADQALIDGSVEEMIDKISDHISAGIKEKFMKVLEAKKNKDKSVDAGREFVEAYINYTHYIEGIHTAIISAGDHLHSIADENPAPAVIEQKEHHR